jgi:hypothetical protein
MFFRGAREKARRDRIESLAEGCQLELYRTLAERLKEKYGPEISGKIAAGLANYIIQFGLRNPAHTSDKLLLISIDTEMANCAQYLGHKFQQNTLGCIILLGSLRQIPLAKFKEHIKMLHSVGLFKLGPDTPNVAHDLPEQDLVYMYEAATL